VPLRERAKVESLAQVLPERGLLNAEESERLAARLAVTSHGFDIHASRPNAVILMRGGATDRAMDLARSLGDMVYGGQERVIRIDFGRLTSQWDSKTLLGTSAGYIGYEDRHELDQVIEWLTGFDSAALERHLEAGTTFEDFFAGARLNPRASSITGVVCGVRVEGIEDPLMQKIRYLDKLVDELAKGKPMDKILRA